MILKLKQFRREVSLNIWEVQKTVKKKDLELKNGIIILNISGFIKMIYMMGMEN